MAFRGGFTLVELLIVVVVMGVVAAMIIPRFEPGITSQLTAAGGIVLADLDYARQLAVMNQSSYQVEVDDNGTLYTISHSGANTSFDTLPQSAFRRPSDPTDEHIGRFADFPQTGIELELLGVRPLDADGNPIIEFGPLGELTGGEDTTLWLRATDQRTSYFLPIEVNAVTGLATLGDIRTTNPIEEADAVEAGP